MPRPYDTCSMNPKIGIAITWLGVLLFSETFSPVISPADK